VGIPQRTYTPKAVVDWVAFVVKLDRASHGGHLKRTLEKGVSRVKPLNASLGGAATEFKIELQHPERYAIIQDVIDCLEGSHGIKEKPTLTAMEVSVDFWPKDKEAGDILKQTERLMMSITPPEINNPRLVSHDHSILLPDREANVDPEKTLYIGNKGDDLLWRVYGKRTDETFVGDEGKRLPKPLAQSEWRARAEVRIQGNALAALNLINPGDLTYFSFERLHALRYFKFCHIAKAEPVLSNIWAAAAAKSLGIDEYSPACVLGTLGRRDKRHRPLQLSRYLRTDTELTEAARGALRGLTKHFRHTP
jgi:hypothetical protein